MVRKLLKLNVLFSLTLSFLAVSAEIQAPFKFVADSPKGLTLGDLPPEIASKYVEQLTAKIGMKTSFVALSFWKSLLASDMAALESLVGGELAADIKDEEKLAKLQDVVRYIDFNDKNVKVSLLYGIENFKFEKKDGDVYKNQNLKILASMSVSNETEEKVFHIIFETSAVTKVPGANYAEDDKELTAKTEAEAAMMLLMNSPDIKITEFRLTPENGAHNTKEEAIFKDGEGIEGIEDLVIQIPKLPLKPAPESSPKAPAPKTPAPRGFKAPVSA